MSTHAHMAWCWLLTPLSSESTEYYVSQIHQHNRTMSIPWFFWGGILLCEKFRLPGKILGPPCKQWPLWVVRVDGFAAGGGSYYYVGQEMLGNTLKTLINFTCVQSFSLFSKIQSWLPSRVRNMVVVNYLHKLGTGKNIKVTLQR